MASLDLTPPTLSVLGFFEGIDFEARQRATAADIQLKRSQKRSYDINTRFQQMTLQSRADAISRENLAAQQKYEQSKQAFPLELDIARQKLEKGGLELTGAGLELRSLRQEEEAAELRNACGRGDADACARLKRLTESLTADKAAAGGPQSSSDLLAALMGRNKRDALTPTDVKTDSVESPITGIQSKVGADATTTVPKLAITPKEQTFWGGVFGSAKDVARLTTPLGFIYPPKTKSSVSVAEPFDWSRTGRLSEFGR